MFVERYIRNDGWRVCCTSRCDGAVSTYRQWAVGVEAPSCKAGVKS